MSEHWVATNVLVQQAVPPPSLSSPLRWHFSRSSPFSLSKNGSASQPTQHSTACRVVCQVRDFGMVLSVPRLSPLLFSTVLSLLGPCFYAQLSILTCVSNSVLIKLPSQVFHYYCIRPKCTSFALNPSHRIRVHEGRRVYSVVASLSMRGLVSETLTSCKAQSLDHSANALSTLSLSLLRSSETTQQETREVDR